MMDQAGGVADADALADAVIARAEGRPRFVVALAGAPGSGKSTLSDALQRALEERGAAAVIVPMDGFHLDNAVIGPRGLLARKGSPLTFDAAGYHALLRRIRDRPDEAVAVPVFDRGLDLARAGARIVEPGHRIVITEGNYLLLDEAPWSDLAGLFDLTVMVFADADLLRRRLIDRWLGHGHDAEAAEHRAMQNDIPNAELVLARSRTADLMVHG
ncbi:phosphoribulokinase/uridine kinase family protein [Hoeflea marina]|uniref:Phosphoribulokinase/uridine kinase family protein n=1 Tax=Hoeflea marina TaxID=274592 RepID=A0A317PR97_9HYPH|nr:nucleoside triphosphate hydrolase [Hoeflea marina]PWW01394.1 phosphoribulokinase/uridine kinase family protein [Hoeflea marina]